MPTFCEIVCMVHSALKLAMPYTHPYQSLDRPAAAGPCSTIDSTPVSGVFQDCLTFPGLDTTRSFSLPHHSCFTGQAGASRPQPRTPRARGQCPPKELESKKHVPPRKMNHHAGQPNHCAGIPRAQASHRKANGGKWGGALAWLRVDSGPPSQQQLPHAPLYLLPKAQALQGRRGAAS